ncbi:wD repeat-containing protein 61 [Moesziomyces antarcticus]|uniref:WD repeat-containing protein 61 n=1 Tax=Pseudozyma antarctica TaxID=84753 RepID=A0A081CE85_PSEA2|nr:wD repeat-containing protein 61 [Moesziomyces antarcticus]GAK64981.1 wD repeat-containing protein 61 [Moesziomyces antarcticus]
MAATFSRPTPEMARTGPTPLSSPPRLAATPPISNRALNQLSRKHRDGKVALRQVAKRRLSLTHVYRRGLSPQSLQFLSDKETLAGQSHSSPVVSVCWTRPSTSTAGLVISGDTDGRIKLFDAHSARAYRNLPVAHHNAVHCITANHTGTTVLTSAIDGTITAWNLEPFAAQLSPGDDVDQDGEVPLLLLPVEDAASLITGQIDSLPACPVGEAAQGGKLSEAWQTALHPTLPCFAAVGAGATLTLHATPTSGDAVSFGTMLGRAQPPPSRTGSKDLFGLSLAFHASGTLLAVGTNTGRVLLYMLTWPSPHKPVLDLVAMFADHPAPIRALSFTDTLLLVGSDDRTVSVHDVQPILTAPGVLSDEEHVRLAGTVASLAAHKGWVLALGAPAASTVFASVGADKTIKFWDLASATKSTPVFSASEVKPIRAFAFQPRAGDEGTEATMTRFVTASEDGALRWYRSAGLG